MVGRRNSQCDQIGRFLKVLGDNYLSKVAAIFGDFWAILKTQLFVEPSLVTFYGHLRKN